MTREQLESEKATLNRKLEASERAGTGYSQRIIAIKARLAWVEEQLEQNE